MKAFDFPLLANAETVSQPVNACSPIRDFKNPVGLFQAQGGRVLLDKEVGGGAWTSRQVWRQNLGQGPAKFIKYEEKFGKFCHHKKQKLRKDPIWGSYLKFRGQNLGYLSFIFFEAKFGAKPPPRPHNMEVPPLGFQVASLWRFDLSQI